MKHKLIIILVFININFIYSQIDKKDYIFKNLQNEFIDISIDTNYLKFIPTTNEILLSKDLLYQYLDSIFKNDGKSVAIKSIKNDYYKQYLGYIDENGDKIIYINACCSAYKEDFDFDQDWIFVFDGGVCFFQTIINITTKECLRFSFNGSA